MLRNAKVSSRSNTISTPWYFVALVTAAIDISYFDRQTLPVAISAIQRTIPLSLLGGWFCSSLLRRGHSPGFSLKLALGLSALFMPVVMLVPHVPVGWALALFSIAFFCQQSRSGLIMTLPADIFPLSVAGSVSGLIGFGGASEARSLALSRVSCSVSDLDIEPCFYRWDISPHWISSHPPLWR